jgi:hypothetical protein
MNLIIFRRVTESQSFLNFLLTGLSNLWQSGIFEVLRDIGKVPPVTPENPNYVALQATMYAWSLGYNQALDDLVYFKEKFLDVDRSRQRINPDFGGLDEALKKGDLTQEEINGIRGEQYSDSTERNSNSSST